MPAPRSLPLTQLFKVLLGIVALIARQRHVLQSVGLLGQRGLDLFLDRFEAFARFIRPAGVADADALARLGIGGDARVIKALVGFFLGTLTFAAAFVHSF